MTKKAKDKLAWALIYGGGTVAKGVLLAVAVAAGLLSPGFARAFTQATRNQKKKVLDSIWQDYQSTGKISLDMVDWEEFIN